MEKEKSTTRKIGIILHPYDEDKPAGLARTIFEFTKGMLEIDDGNEYTIFLKKLPKVAPVFPGKNWKIKVLGGKRFWLENLRNAPKMDVYIFNTPMMPIFWRPQKSIVIALDFAYWYLLPKTLRGQALKWITYFLHLRALRRADSIVAISKATRKDISSLFKINEKKVKVIYCGFKKICETPEQNINLPGKFFFFAGIIKPRKNVLNIVKAFHFFLKSNTGYSLVIGGNGAGSYYEEIQSYVKDNNLENLVIFVGHLNDAELSYAYKRAYALVFPTLIEGFGYPVLEAMDCGTPVITSNQSSLVEVGGNNSALLVYPYDSEDIASALEKIVKNPKIREDLVEKGYEQSKRFSWNKAARELSGVMGGDTSWNHKKTLIMTIQRGIIVRNFFHSGVVEKLIEKGFRIVALVPHYWDDDAIKEIKREGIVFERPPKSPRQRLKRLLDEFSKGVIFNDTVHVRYLYRFAGNKPNRLFYIIRMVCFVPLKFAPGFKDFLRYLERIMYPQRECDYLFSKYKPDLVFNTAAGQDFSLMKSARRYNVPTIEMPKSWDNSSKLLYRTKADYVFAWGPFMGGQLYRYQGYKPNEIIITGTPQFDFYVKKKHLLNIEEFCRKHNFNPSKKIILYVSTGGDCCDEVDYIKLLKRYIENGDLKNVQVLIRPHLKYRGDMERFLSFEKYENFAIDKSDKQNSTLRDNWDTSINHISNLFNSLYHADICINIGSTIILDAAACGTPSININFDINKNVSPHRSTKRLYMSDYMKAATNTGGTLLINSEGEFLFGLKHILERGNTDTLKEKREKLISYIMYKNDGMAAERITSAIGEIIERNTI